MYNWTSQKKVGWAVTLTWTCLDGQHTWSLYANIVYSSRWSHLLQSHRQPSLIMAGPAQPERLGSLLCIYSGLTLGVVTSHYRMMMERVHAMHLSGFSCMFLLACGFLVQDLLVVTTPLQCAWLTLQMRFASGIWSVWGWVHVTVFRRHYHPLGSETRSFARSTLGFPFRGRKESGKLCSLQIGFGAS